MRNPRIRRRRGTVNIPTHASYSPLEARTEAQTSRVVQMAVSDLTGRIVQTDAEIDAATIITPEDEERAVKLWDDAQEDAGTRLEGLLNARIDDGDR